MTYQQYAKRFPIRQAQQRSRRENLMMVKLNITSQLFQPKEADELAVKLNGNVDDDWAYVVHHDPTGKGYSFIKIYDEDGKFVSKL